MDFHCTKGREGRRLGEESLLSPSKIQHPALLRQLQRSAPMATTVKHRGRMLSEDERRVAEILLELPKLLEPFRSLSDISWGRKRRRSSFPAAPSPPSSGERTLLKVEAASPATPLSFSPSDADEESRPKVSRRRDVKKRSQKELKEEVARLSAERIQLQHECTKRSKYRDELQALNLRLNSRLKEKQNQLSLQASYQPHLSQCRSFDLIGNLKAGAFQGNEYPNINHLLVRPTSADCRTEDNAGVPYSDGQPSLAWTSSGSRMALEIHRMALENHSMRVGVLDLNAPPKEAISLDFIQIPVQFNKKAAIAAEARKRRMEINRGKSSLALKLSRLR